MDDDRFDRLARLFGGARSRRSALRAMAGLAGALGLAVEEGEAGRRRKRVCPRARRCGTRCCPNGKFCCDDKRGVCCAKGDGCCNPGPGTGTCCADPNRCAKPIGDDDGATVCCPTQRQWFTSTLRVRCCPKGTRSLGMYLHPDHGPCCPAANFCGTADSGGGDCCDEGYTCCGGRMCCPTTNCFACSGDTCVYLCDPETQICNTRDNVCVSST